MKPISAELLALLTSRQALLRADLYTFTLTDGTVLRTCGADVPLTAGGITYASCSPAIDRSKVSVSVGVEVDTVSLVILPKVTQLINGSTWTAACRRGDLDGATVLIETAYLTTWPTVVGTLHKFFGLVSDIEPSRSRVKLSIKSALELLNRPFPLNVYQAPCVRTLYSAGCGVNRAAFTSTAAVFAATDTAIATIGTMPQVDRYFDQGVLRFTSGPLLGQSRTVRYHSTVSGNTYFRFSQPLLQLPDYGNTFEVYPGCDKKQATCGSKFSNLDHFRGFPYVPVPETPFG